MLDQTAKKNKSLGDRMKSYETVESKKLFLPNLPIYCRIDGRCFSKFTKGMIKPFDLRMSQIMIEVTKHLVKETGATLGYTQSDEISLVWEEGKFFFNGRVQKMVSNITSIATSKFLIEALKVWPEKCNDTLPTFDARVFQVPSKEEAANSFLWRAQDAKKNAISMAAHEIFGHQKTLGKNGEEKIDMMNKLGIDFNDYPNFFKFGTFVRNESYEMSIKELNLPEDVKEKQKSDTFIRNKVVELDLGNFSDISNRVGFIFNKEKPVKK